MEKISALIEKLQELKNSGADLQAISYYVQLLQAEVLHARSKQHQQETQSRQNHIAVIMPSQQPVVETKPASTAAQTTTLPSNKPVEAPTPVPEKPVEEDVNTRAARMNDAPTAVPHTTIIVEDINTRAARMNETAAAVPAADLIPPKPQPVVTQQPIPTPAVTQPPVQEKQKPAVAATLFDTVEEPVRNGNHTTADGLRKDLNELAGNNNNTSLNDRLRHQQVEIAQKLGEMPVNDLRHAIGINDKYQFIQELFRGDTDLYERSIKTINECGNLQEADYWIQREIKIIQGWEDDHHLVQHFYSLLKKRFS
ncbi:hypothetical protein CLV51_102116 [Chitinophaga niastensis]|uniref:Uncharacterized protein n=1 Tax=Chitinophaga niastensis TaxID=536980 RepID=A0A2P8HM32_CHINA|nr:hypothetical protein [Chitinophaga niastensis]PSL47271.1 hypothetical protein CLV51_102116 [Chitinophaga niastensis]